MKIWGRGHDAVERALQGARPVANDEFVAGLNEQVRATTRRPQSHRASRLAFGAAMTVFMVGTFASFGGLGYAATNAAATKAAPANSQSAAGAQYDEEKVPTVGQSSAAKPTLTPPNSPATVSVAGESTAPKSTSTLPFTGLGLGATALLGSMLLVFGVLLRRREEARE